MKTHFSVIIVLSLSVCGCKDTGPPKAVSPTPLISIDCTEAGLGNLSAGFVMDWVAELADENGGSGLVVLRDGKRNFEFHFHAGEGDESPITVCYSVVEFRKDGIVLNDEVLLPDEFGDRLAFYAEAARLTESTASMIVAASHLIKLKDCMENFEKLYDNGIRHIILR